MDRGLAASRLGIIEAWQIVVHQRRAVQQLDGGSGRSGGVRIAIAAGIRDGEAELGTDALAPGKTE